MPSLYLGIHSFKCENETKTTIFCALLCCCIPVSRNFQAFTQPRPIWVLRYGIACGKLVAFDRNRWRFSPEYASGAEFNKLCNILPLHPVQLLHTVSTAAKIPNNLVFPYSNHTPSVAPQSSNVVEVAFPVSFNFWLFAKGG